MTTDDRLQEHGEADADVRARLEAYASAALAPDPAATVRARAAILAEARRRAASASTVGSGPGFARRRPSFRAALGPGLLAAALLVLLVGAGGVVASAPGGPLYGVRLWAEQMTLPAQPAARVDAQLNRLDERLGEAEVAAEAGNGDAVAAALEAYRSEMEDAVDAAATDPGTKAEVAARLETHRAVLAALAARLPERAAEAIIANLVRTESKILEALGATPPQSGPGASPDPGRTPPGRPEATPSDRPRAPEATPTPKPGRTPPGRPEETEKPGRTPPGRPATPAP
jgi:Domain of unknown function (DUF5667)